MLDIENPTKTREVNWQSTMHFEEIDYRLRANAHHLSYPDSEHFIGAIGDHIYRFHVDDLKSPENLGPHRLENAHELRWDSNRRYILIGDLGPGKQDVRQVGVGWRVLDGIYATRVSPDGQFIIAGNRVYNVVAVYDRKTFKKVYETLLPFRRDVYGNTTDHYRFTNRFMGHHLGVHQRTDRAR